MEYIVAIGLIILTYGALLADIQAIWSDMPDMQCKKFREHASICMLFALLPLCWIVHPFITGFYQHGLQFLPKKESV